MTVIDTEPDLMVAEQPAQTVPAPTNRMTLIYHLLAGGLGTTLLAVAVLTLAGHAAVGPAPSTPAALVATVTISQRIIS